MYVYLLVFSPYILAIFFATFQPKTISYLCNGLKNITSYFIGFCSMAYQEIGAKTHETFLTYLV